jgi:hypothetical protein
MAFNVEDETKSQRVVTIRTEINYGEMLHLGTNDTMCRATVECNLLLIKMITFHSKIVERGVCKSRNKRVHARRE